MAQLIQPRACERPPSTRHPLQAYLTILAAALLSASPSGASPPPVRETGRSLNIFFVGDSITVGERDRGVRKPIYDNTAGVPQFGFIPRASAALPEISLRAVGFEGKSTLRIMEELDHKLKDSTQLRALLKEADVVVYAGGLNDYWERIAPRSAVLRSRTFAVKLQTLAPRAKIFVASLISPLRLAHNQWVFQYNRVLLSNSLKNIAVGPRFDALPAEELSKDGLHPSSTGYDRLAGIVTEFICQQYNQIKQHGTDNVTAPAACAKTGLPMIKNVQSLDTLRAP